MTQNPKRIIGRMAVRLFSLSVEDYLVSENFSRFCRDHDLDDAWKESLDLSRDRPDLYGDDVMKNAFVGFLNHTFHSRTDEFPALFIRFLSGFSRAISRPLPLDGLIKDLMDLGYTDELPDGVTLLPGSRQHIP